MHKQPMLKRSLFSWVLSSSKKLQLSLLLVILVMVFFRVLPLEIQKRIVNDVFSTGNFPTLLVYCLVYLAAVVLASLLKLVMNWLQTLIGQRAMTDMRRDMYQHILRLPLSFFRNTQAGTVVSSLVNELSTSGNFVGMAIAAPLCNSLTLLAFGVYLIWLNPLLGMVTLAIYPTALVVIPFIQKGADKANKKRVAVSRQMASQITESIAGIHELHAHGSFRTEEKKYNDIIENLLQIRIVWTVYRYAVKVSNNLFIGLGPVLVFILGGYLFMQGKIELGSIIAFLSAQEKLYDPWKELIEFYQVYQDASVRYKEVIRAFDEKTEFVLDQKRKVSGEVAGNISIKNLEFTTGSGITLLEGINLTIKAGEHVALVGFSGSGKSTLARCIGQMYSYTGGEILLDGQSVAELSKEEIIKSIGFISQSPFLFTGSISDNLLYSYDALKYYPASADDLTVPTLDEKITVLQQSGLFVDILRFGLSTVLDREKYPELEQRLLAVRGNFKTSFGAELADYVEFYDEDKYLHHANVAENILFGTPRQKEFNIENLAVNEQFLRFLDHSNLRVPLLETGAELLRQTVDILGDRAKDSIFFEQTPVQPDDYEDCHKIVAFLAEKKVQQLDREEQQILLETAFHFVPATHKITALQPLLEKMILSGRDAFRAWCATENPDAVAFFTEADYLGAQSILQNIFFGSLISDAPAVEVKVDQCVVHLLIEEDLLEQIAAIGMEFNVGSNGDKLSGGQQQKLAIARVFLKHPKVMIMDEATSALDNKSQTRIQKIMEQWKGRCTAVAVIHRLDLLPSFDKVAVMKNGKIVEWGEPESLITDKGILYELIHGKR